MDRHTGDVGQWFATTGSGSGLAAARAGARPAPTEIEQDAPVKTRPSFCPGRGRSELVVVVELDHVGVVIDGLHVHLKSKIIVQTFVI